MRSLQLAGVCQQIRDALQQASRAAAIEAQATALDSFYIDGIRHNIPFLSALMNHPRWRGGNLSTGFIAEEFPKGFAVRVPDGEVARRLAAVIAKRASTRTSTPTRCSARPTSS